MICFFHHSLPVLTIHSNYHHSTRTQSPHHSSPPRPQHPSHITYTQYHYTITIHSQHQTQPHLTMTIKSAWLTVHTNHLIPLSLFQSFTAYNQHHTHCQQPSAFSLPESLELLLGAAVDVGAVQVGSDLVDLFPRPCRVTQRGVGVIG